MVLMGKIVLTIFLIIISVSAIAQNDDKLIITGNDLYHKQQFDKAAEQYRKAAEINASNPKARYNLGNALYKSKKTDEAEKAFNDAAEKYKDKSLKSKALYNEGVTLTRQNKLAESADAYKESLKLNPEDEEARQNLQKALNELKKQPPPPQQQPKDNKNKPENKKKQPKPQPENKSKLNKKQVEQMLNALRQDEKKLQQELQKKNNMGAANGKDW